MSGKQILKRIAITHDRDDRGELGFLVTPYYQLQKPGVPYLMTVSCPPGGAWATYAEAVEDVLNIIGAAGKQPEGTRVEYVLTATAPAWFGIDQTVGMIC